MTRRPRIVLAYWAPGRFIGEEDLAILDEVGDVLDPAPIGRWDDELADDLLARADVIVGHWGCPRLTASVVDRAPDLGLFAYAAGTVKDTVDADVFDRIRVTSGAAANAEPVAEYTLAMILLANKDVLWQRDVGRDPSIAEQREPMSAPVGNWDKTIGIVGASLIGRRVLDLLRPFPALRPLLYDPFVPPDEAASLGAEKVDLATLCERADVVSVHAPDLPSTRHMIGEDELAAMRTGATLINTARGALLDHDALARHTVRLNAVLDVTEPEPLPADHPLRRAPSVTLTPHVAGSQGTELRRMTRFVADEIRRWTMGEPGHNTITREMLDRIA